MEKEQPNSVGNNSKKYKKKQVVVRLIICKIFLLHTNDNRNTRNTFI